MIRRAIALLAGIALCLTPITLVDICVAAEDVTSSTKSTVLREKTDNGTLPFYSEVFGEYPEIYTDCEPIVIPLERAVTDAGEVVTCNNGSIYWEEAVTALTWAVTVPQDGRYLLNVRYQSWGDVHDDMVRAVKIDGKFPFYEAQNITFYNLWQDQGEVMVNNIGDEIRPDVVQINSYQEVYVTDSLGWNAAPLAFYLTAGEHTFTMQFVSQAMELAGLSFVPDKAIATYDEVAKTYPQTDAGVREYTFEAEDAMVFKNDATIRMESNSDPATNPLRLGYRTFNTIGGYRWRSGNQTVTMKFAVEEAGLYQLGIRYLQSWNDGLPSYRTIMVDGEVPFAEMYDYKFKYGYNWQSEVLSDSEGTPYLFYLDVGEHTLQMRVTMGNLEPLLRSVYSSLQNLSDMLLDIRELTGADPDPNYNYEFFRYIPTLQEDMETLKNELLETGDFLVSISSKTSSMSSNMKASAEQIRSMIEDPFSIASRITLLESLQTKLGSWYSELQSQPLQIDSFKWAQPKATVSFRMSTFFERLWSTVVNFGMSFIKDYDNVGGIDIGDIEIEDTLSVWIARGTEWAEIVKELVDANFTPQSKTLVNINIVPASQLNAGSTNALMLSLISGDAPDVAMSVSADSPVEFAIRDVVVDMSRFADYEEVKDRFLKNIMVAYTYRGGVYALPETMDFTALFYRTDIFEKYGFRVPDTRKELYDDLLPELYRHGMQYYQPVAFTPFLLQHHGAYYTEDGLSSALNTPEAFAAFEEFTQMFTHYSCPVNASFFNRFRTGEMPVGIGDYSLYIQLNTAAPELLGQWTIAPLPGKKEADGSINRTSGGIAGACDIILTKNEQRQERAWEFLKWWTAENTQKEYARELEALVGVEARWNSANVNAFYSLNWKSSDIKVLETQWEWSQEVPVVLGGYYTTRYINNAFNSVVVSANMTVRDALENSYKEIDREMKAKQKEYGVAADD